MLLCPMSSPTPQLSLLIIACEKGQQWQQALGLLAVMQ